MKAVIVEIRSSRAAALTDDGRIIKVKNSDYAIGQIIELKMKMTRRSKLAALAASAAAVVVMLGVSAWAYVTPYSYVSLDVNPSIQYSVNRFGRVLHVEAVNGDGADILKNLSLDNRPIDEAVQATVEQIEKAGYFSGKDPGGIILATSSENPKNAEALAKKLQDTAQKATKDAASPVEVDSIRVGYDRVTEARTLGTTPGKLNLVQKLQASEGNADSVNVQEWLKKPVKDIMKAIKSAKQESKAEDTADSSESNGSSVPPGSGQKVKPKPNGNADSSHGKDSSKGPNGPDKETVGKLGNGSTKTGADSSSRTETAKPGGKDKNSPADSSSSKVAGKPGNGNAKDKTDSSSKSTGKPQPENPGNQNGKDRGNHSG